MAQQGITMAYLVICCVAGFGGDILCASKLQLHLSRQPKKWLERRKEASFSLGGVIRNIEN